MKIDSINDILLICPVSIIGVNSEGVINIFNEAAVKLLEYKEDEVINKKIVTDLYNPPHKAREVKKRIYSDEYGVPGRLEDYETELVSKSGKIIPILLSASILEENGKESGSIGFFHDLTKIKMMEDELRKLSITDSLTGLYNQRYFHMKINDEFDRFKRYKRPLSLICFDLDNFKLVNDVLGHLEGDKILKIAGESIKSVLRHTDYPFRYGGDEFMIILAETDLDDAYKTAKRIHNNFNKEWPFTLTRKDDKLHQITLSIGIAQAYKNDDIEKLIRRADIVMYKAKNNGGNRIEVAAYDIPKQLK